MACTASKTPLLRAVAARGYSAQASPKAAATNLNIQTTKLANKLVVASQDSHSPVSRVSILFRAGSRNETYETQGAAHVLRISGGLSTKTATGFGIIRNLQQVGGSLSVSANREVISYTVELTNNNLETGLKYLEAATTGQLFKPWELTDSLPRLRHELAGVTTQVKAVELLHKAVFRNGLGNSVFCPDHQIGKISSETMQHFFNTNCTASRAAVVGVGVDHQVLSGFAQNLDLGSGDGTTHPTSHFVGELRCDTAGHHATVAVGTQVEGWVKDVKEAIAFAVLQFAAGVAPATKRGAHNGVLTKAVSGAAANVGVSTIYSCYSDSSLFGFVVSGDKKDIGKAVEAGVSTMKSCSVSDSDVARGKAGLKFHVADLLLAEGNLIHDIGDQIVIAGSAHSPSAILALIDSVSAADVKAAARKISSSKLSVAAIGNLSHVPYMSQLN